MTELPQCGERLTDVPRQILLAVRSHSAYIVHCPVANRLDSKVLLIGFCSGNFAEASPKEHMYVMCMHVSFEVR